MSRSQKQKNKIKQLVVNACIPVEPCYNFYPAYTWVKNYKKWYLRVGFVSAWSHAVCGLSNTLPSLRNYYNSNCLNKIFSVFPIIDITLILNLVSTQGDLSPACSRVLGTRIILLGLYSRLY
jgi:hypothetical protein